MKELVLENVDSKSLSLNLIKNNLKRLCYQENKYLKFFNEFNGDNRYELNK